MKEDKERFFNYMVRVHNVSIIIVVFMLCVVFSQKEYAIGIVGVCLFGGLYLLSYFLKTIKESGKWHN